MKQIEIIRLIQFHKVIRWNLKSYAVGFQTHSTRLGKPRVESCLAYIVEYEAAALLPLHPKFVSHRFLVFRESPILPTE